MPHQTNLNLDVQATMSEVITRLKKLYPDLQFLFAMIPFHKTQTNHLSKEQMRELEKRVTRAATAAFYNYIEHPDKLSDHV